MSLRTVEETREWFEVTGQTVTQWARDNGFSASVVYALLSRRTLGRRGNAHRAAVALRLKPDISPFDRPSEGRRRTRTVDRPQEVAP